MHLSIPALRPATPALLTPDSPAVPEFSGALQPPLVLGAATLATAAMQGTSLAGLCAMVQRPDADPAGLIFDTGLIHQIAFLPDEARRFQLAALEASSLFRVRPTTDRPPTVRMLALMSPGDLMANTPLDFITNHLDVQLDLLFMQPGRPLPETVPDHDVMIFASSEPDAATLDIMARLYAAWPRPVLNDPACLPRLARDRLPTALGGIADLLSPAATVVARKGLEAVGAGQIDITDLVPGDGYPVLIRPIHSHAGIGLEKMDGPGAIAGYLQRAAEDQFYVTAFVDYRSADGLFRKYRVGFIDGEAFLCHMAVSEHWMVHYLNAGMVESAAKRAVEAEAMAGFDDGFGARHAEAFRALHAALGFDFYTLDCSELADGRLLVFEADTAAIIHMMDPADMFPYKHVQMRRVFTAFDAMLRRRVGAQ